MTIPSRPAPAPPTPSSNQQQRQDPANESNSQNFKIVINKLPPPPNKKNITINYSTVSGTNSTVTKTKHFPQVKMKDIPSSSSWEESFNDLNATGNNVNDSFYKKAPPPRPPPPKPITNHGILKKPGPPQSVNILTNLFGRTNKPAISKKPTNIPKPSINMPNSMNPISRNDTTRSSHIRFPNQTSHFSNSNDPQLISFDSPPSSPTFTQKSNSDCVSIDSFSSDSNFSSPNNGSVSQPESGFEDDFIASPPDPWEQVADPYGTIQISSSQTNYGILSDLKVCHPVRNLNTLNKISSNKIDNQLCNGKNLLPPVPTLAIPTIIRPKSPQHQPQLKYLAPKPSMFNQVKLRPTMATNSNTDYSNKHNFADKDDDDPPMPKYPPPPAPQTVLNDEQLNDDCSSSSTIIEDIDNDSPPYAIALYNFDGAEIGDLSFRENEKIYLLSQVSETWYSGRLKNGCEGIFPSNYIDIKVPLKTNQIDEGASAVAATTKSSLVVDKNLVKVLYTFIAEQPEDLTIYEDEYVKILYKINDEWLYGKIHNKEGQFPANFVEYIPDTISYKCP